MNTHCQSTASTTTNELKDHWHRATFALTDGGILRNPSNITKIQKILEYSSTV
jgi:nitrite reductase/ring-hydroxylating ferredoxin subunit